MKPRLRALFFPDGVAAAATTTSSASSRPPPPPEPATAPFTGRCVPTGIDIAARCQQAAHVHHCRSPHYRHLSRTGGRRTAAAGTSRKAAWKEFARASIRLVGPPTSRPRAEATAAAVTADSPRWQEW